MFEAAPQLLLQFYALMVGNEFQGALAQSVLTSVVMLAADLTLGDIEALASNALLEGEATELPLFVDCSGDARRRGCKGVSWVILGFRTCEAMARVGLLALFAAKMGPTWTFVVVALDVVAVTAWWLSQEGVRPLTLSKDDDAGGAALVAGCGTLFMPCVFAITCCPATAYICGSTLRNRMKGADSAESNRPSSLAMWVRTVLSGLLAFPGWPGATLHPRMMALAEPATTSDFGVFLWARGCENITLAFIG